LVSRVEPDTAAFGHGARRIGLAPQFVRRLRKKNRIAGILDWLMKDAHHRGAGRVDQKIVDQQLAAAVDPDHRWRLFQPRHALRLG
jgi:hypothetical protein